MSREAGYYWVKVRSDSQWEVLYTDGVAWRRGERLLFDRDLFDYHEERLPSPEDRPRAVAVPVGAWAQALNASEAIRVGDTGSAEAALGKMQRILSGDMSSA